MNVFFEKAVPVWVTGREKEMNLRVQFKTVVGKGKAIIAKIVTSGIYHMSVNGKFVCYGPARAGRGFFRVDEIDLTPFADQEQNTVIIEVCGYNARSYYLIKQDSFLTAELSADGRVEAYTGNNFTARINPEYIKSQLSAAVTLLESLNMTSDPSLLEAVKTGLEQGNIPSPMAVVIQQMWVNVFFGSLLSAVMAWLVSVWFKSSKTKK